MTAGINCSHPIIDERVAVSSSSDSIMHGQPAVEDRYRLWMQVDLPMSTVHGIRE